MSTLKSFFKDLDRIDYLYSKFFPATIDELFAHLEAELREFKEAVQYYRENFDKFQENSEELLKAQRQIAYEYADVVIMAYGIVCKMCPTDTVIEGLEGKSDILFDRLIDALKKRLLDVKKAELKRKLHQYILEHPNCYTLEIVEAFDEYETYEVLKALESLQKEGKVK